MEAVKIVMIFRRRDAPASRVEETIQKNSKTFDNQLAIVEKSPIPTPI